ncbi:MAG: hypothetical protein WC082_08515 [Victivallales bacterium]|jgi:hypothetical protein
MNKKVWLPLAFIVTGALVFLCWPSPTPLAYQTRLLGKDSTGKIINFVEKAYRQYRESGSDYKKEMLKKTVWIGDEDLIRDFFSEMKAIDEPDFRKARVSSPVSRPSTYLVDFNDKKTKIRIVVNTIRNNLFLTECKRQSGQ